MPKGIKRTDGKNARSVAVHKYQTEKRDRVVFRLRKGYKSILKDYCAQNGISMNQFVLDCINKCTDLNLE